MEDELLEHGFRKTRIPNEFIKRRFNVKLGEDSLIITNYNPRVGRLVWTETYYNFDNFRRYLKKEHQLN